MFQKIGSSLFSSALKKSGIHKQVEDSYTIDIANTVIKERFGEGADVHAKARYVKNRRLAIEVAHPAISDEIRRLESTIIAQINDKVGRPEITSLFFLLPKHEQQITD